MDLYRENLLDHYRNPRNFGRPPSTWRGGYTWEELNPSCGDRIGVAIETDKDKEKVVDISFWGEGCVVSMAAMSMLTEEVKRRKSIKSVKGITGEDVLKLLGGKGMIPPARLNCAFLGLEALRKALGTGIDKDKDKEKEKEKKKGGPTLRAQ